MSFNSPMACEAIPMKCTNEVDVLSRAAYNLLWQYLWCIIHNISEWVILMRIIPEGAFSMQAAYCKHYWNSGLDTQ